MLLLYGCLLYFFFRFFPLFIGVNHCSSGNVCGVSLDPWLLNRFVLEEVEVVYKVFYVSEK